VARTHHKYMQGSMSGITVRCQ